MKRREDNEIHIDNFAVSSPKKQWSILTGYWFFFHIYSLSSDLSYVDGADQQTHLGEPWRKHMDWSEQV